MNLIHCNRINPIFHQSKLLNLAVPSYGKRTVTEYEFDYILSSDSGKIITNGDTINLASGMFFVRTPGTVVEGIPHYISWYIRFQTPDFFPFSSLCCKLPLEICCPIFQQIYDLHIQKPADYLYHIDYLMNTLIYHLYLETEQKRISQKDKNPLTDIYREMEQNYNKNYSLDHYVSLSGYSKSRFCHLFKEFYQLSPMQFLQNQRLRNLCYQLIETERPIKELMIENGFRNEQSFFRQFKEYTGETPLSYRQRHRFR